MWIKSLHYGDCKICLKWNTKEGNTPELHDNFLSHSDLTHHRIFLAITVTQTCKVKKSNLNILTKITKTWWTYVIYKVSTFLMCSGMRKYNIMIHYVIQATYGNGFNKYSDIYFKKWVLNLLQAAPGYSY